MKTFYFALAIFILGINSGSYAQNLEIEGSAVIDGSTFNVDSDNNRVGIGTSTPMAPLHLKSDIGESMRIDGVNPLISFYNGVTYNGFLQYTGSEMRLFNQNPNDLSLGTNNTVRLTIDGNGKVGIGTNNPDALLHVNGNVIFEGGLEMSTSTEAFMPPSLTTSERDLLPMTFGSMIYNTDVNKFQGYAHGNETQIVSFDFDIGSYSIDMNQSIGQSYTFPVDGYVTEFWMMLDSIILGGDFNLKIFDGEGLAGPLLHSQVFPMNSTTHPYGGGVGFVKILLDTQLNLISDQVITFDVSTVNNAQVYISTNGIGSAIYFGGNLIINGGSPILDDDLVFFVTHRAVGWRDMNN